MKKVIVPFLLVGLFVILISSKPIPQTPEEVLSQISFVDSFSKIKNDTTMFASTYVVWFKMPIDHNDPNSPTFPLKGYYSHRDFSKPMVVVIDGYAMYTSRPNELSRILGSNQLTIEHRFFDQSRPKDSIPWSKLTIRQAAADEHQIIQAFKPFYHAKWASTGISKSGQTTIFHRRFYPNDVDVSVPYVAPLNQSNEEPRVYSFLKTVGTPEIRAKIYQYQLELFKNKGKIFPLFKKLAEKEGWHFTMGLERAYDLSVLEYSFAFWQWGMPSDSIPPKGSSPKVLFKHFAAVNPFTFFEEAEVETSRPFFYQAMTEMGMYGYDVKPFKKYLKDTTNITFGFTMPKGYAPVFQPESMRDIDQWVKDSANFMLYIYGQNDAWSSTAVDLTAHTNAVKMMNPGGSHGTRIRSFPQPMQDSIYTVLGKWMEVDLSALKQKTK